MLHNMSPSVVAIMILALTNGVVSSQSPPKSTNVNTLDNECSLTKTVYELRADLKITIFKLESWKSEMDRDLLVVKEEETKMTSTVDKLKEMIDKQSKQMKDVGEEVDSKIEKQAEDMESKLDGLKVDMETKFDGFKVDMKSKLDGLQAFVRNLTQLTTNREKSIDVKLKEMNANLNSLSLSLETVNTKFTLLEGKVGGMKEDIKNNAQETVSLVKERISQVVTESQRNLTAHLRSHSTGGAVYNRWGATTCQQGSRLVYSGVLGGGHYAHTGAPADSLCLPDDPGLRKPTGGTITYIYGAQYEIPSKQNYNIPCAVCDTGNRTKIYMIPAKSVCPDGWTKEYSGMLATGHYSQVAQSDLVCLDQSMETIARSRGDGTGKRFYNVATECNPPLCPNYVSGQLLTCAVCSG